MAFLFNRQKARSSRELCQSLRALLQRLQIDDKPHSRTDEELASILSQMKVVLQGTSEIEYIPQQAHQLIEYMLSENVLQVLAASIQHLPFESRKDVQTIFSHVFRFKTPGNEDPIALNTIVNVQPEVVITLCHGYDHRESALPCGAILKEALKHENVAAIVFYDEPALNGAVRGLAGIAFDQPASSQGVLWKFFEWIDKGVFEVAADAFNTFRDILTRHKRLTSRYLQINYVQFFAKYTSSLLNSSSYVTTRQSIKLLGELLLERQNYHVMRTYIESPQNLKLCMNFLKDERKMISYEAFHVFKIFVASPTKSEGVRKILVQNRDKLLRFLPTFLDGREDDVQFHDEKAYLMRQIELLPNTYTVEPSTKLVSASSNDRPSNPAETQYCSNPSGGGPVAI